MCCQGQFVYRPFRNSAQREAERNAVAPRRGSELVSFVLWCG
jgi:hypothetical protein